MLKWEESNNDIIVVAKYMCGIMTGEKELLFYSHQYFNLDMTEFIKGRGKLKTTQDIIDSAQKIRSFLVSYVNISS